jgi:hypothetical protein
MALLRLLELSVRHEPLLLQCLLTFEVSPQVVELDLAQLELPTRVRQLERSGVRLDLE